MPPGKIFDPSCKETVGKRCLFIFSSRVLTYPDIAQSKPAVMA